MVVIFFLGLVLASLAVPTAFADRPKKKDDKVLGYVCRELKDVPLKSKVPGGDLYPQASNSCVPFFELQPRALGVVPAGTDIWKDAVALIEDPNDASQLISVNQVGVYYEKKFGSFPGWSDRTVSRTDPITAISNSEAACMIYCRIKKCADCPLGSRFSDATGGLCRDLGGMGKFCEYETPSGGSTKECLPSLSKCMYACSRPPGYEQERANNVCKLYETIMDFVGELGEQDARKSYWFSGTKNNKYYCDEACKPPSCDLCEGGVDALRVAPENDKKVICDVMLGGGTFDQKKPKSPTTPKFCKWDDVAKKCSQTTLCNGSCDQCQKCGQGGKTCDFKTCEVLGRNVKDPTKPFCLFSKDDKCEPNPKTCQYCCKADNRMCVLEKNESACNKIKNDKGDDIYDGESYSLSKFNECETACRPYYCVYKRAEPPPGQKEGVLGLQGITSCVNPALTPQDVDLKTRKPEVDKIPWFLSKQKFTKNDVCVANCQEYECCNIIPNAKMGKLPSCRSMTPGPIASLPSDNKTLIASILSWVGDFFRGISEGTVRYIAHLQGAEQCTEPCHLKSRGKNHTPN